MKQWAVLLLCVLLCVLAGCSTVAPQYSGTVAAVNGERLEVDTADGRVTLVLGEDVGIVPGWYVSLEEIAPGMQVKVLCGDYKERGLPMAKKIYVLNENTVAEMGEESTRTVQTVEGLFFEVMQDTVTPGSAKAVLTNTAFDTLLHGSDFYVEKKDGETWRQLAYKLDDYGFTAEGYTLYRGEEASLQFVWVVPHGVLAPGEYRILKPVWDIHSAWDNTQYWLAAEFTVA